MNLNIQYWYYRNGDGLPKNVCDQIIKLAEEKSKKDLHSKRLAQVGGHRQDLSKFPLSKIEKEKLIDTRNSDIQWLNDNWLYKEIHPYVSDANIQAGWNFEYDWSESCQFTTYTKGQHYSWHCDPFHKPSTLKDPNFTGKIRKISMSIQLSEPTEYEGGEFQFDFRNSKDGSPNIRTVSELKEKGSILVFPSHLYHRVLPIKKGKRQSLVVWTIGQPFR